jgi:hypothetical protein
METKTYSERMTEKYLEKIADEIKLCEKERFTGNINFQINLKEGKIGNMNEGVNQSFKY